MSLSGKMGKAHEEFLADLFGGRRTRASGAVWKDQMDGRHSRMDVPFAFAWDGKSTRGKSIGVTREMWAKAVEQAGGERPMLALRWYTTDRLDVGEDLVVLNAHDFAELLEKVNRPSPVRVFITTRDRDEEEDFLHCGVPIRTGVKPGGPLVVMDGEVLKADWVKITNRLGHPDTITAVFDGVITDFPGQQVDVYVDNVLRFSVGPMEGMPKRSMGRVW